MRDKMVYILSSQLILLSFILQIYFRDTYIIHEFIANHRQLALDPIVEMNKDLEFSFSNNYTIQVKSYLLMLKYKKNCLCVCP